MCWQVAGCGQISAYAKVNDLAYSDILMQEELPVHRPEWCIVEEPTQKEKATSIVQAIADGYREMSTVSLIQDSPMKWSS